MFQSEMYRMKLDGSNQSAVWLGGPLNEPSCVAIDRVSRYLYWGSQSMSTIAVVSLDGPMHYRRVILTTVASPVDIAVDSVNGFVLLFIVYYYFISFFLLLIIHNFSSPFVYLILIQSLLTFITLCST